MEIEKISIQIIKAFEDNKDLFKAFEDFRLLGAEKEKLEKYDNLMELINILCKKSKRVLLDTRYEGNSIRQRTIGINQGGLGIKQWSSQLTNFGNDRVYISDNEMGVLLGILKDNVIFNELTKAINKHNVKDLRKVRKFILDEVGSSGEALSIERFNIKIIKEGGEELKIELGGRGNLEDMTFYDKDEESDENYFRLREVKNIIRNGWQNLNKFEDLKMLKEFSSSVLDINLSSVKVFAFLFKNKKHIKDRLAENIKMMNKEMKADTKRQKFVSSILNPIKAVDNL